MTTNAAGAPPAQPAASLSLACAKCARGLYVLREHVGRQAKCPYCGAVLTTALAGGPGPAAAAGPVVVLMTPEQESQRLNQSGASFFAAQKFDDAYLLFRRALGALPAGHPQSFQVLLNLGNACLMLKRLDEAERCYDIVTRGPGAAEPVLAQARLNGRTVEAARADQRGSAEFAAKNYPRALAAFEESYRASAADSPASFAALLNLGVCCSLLDRFADAEGHFNRVMGGAANADVKAKCANEMAALAARRKAAAAVRAGEAPLPFVKDLPEDRGALILGAPRERLVAEFPDFDAAYLRAAFPGDNFEDHSKSDVAVLFDGLGKCRRKSYLLGSLAVYYGRFRHDAARCVDCCLKCLWARAAPVADEDTLPGTAALMLGHIADRLGLPAEARWARAAYDSALSDQELAALTQALAGADREKLKAQISDGVAQVAAQGVFPLPAPAPAPPAAAPEPSGAGGETNYDVLYRIVATRKGGDRAGLAEALGGRLLCGRCREPFIAREGYDEVAADGGSKTYMEVRCPRCETLIHQCRVA